MNEENYAAPIVKVWSVTLGAITLNLANIQAAAATLASLVAIAFTIWQWRKQIREKRKNE